MSEQPERRASVGATSPGSRGDYDPEAVPVRDAATVMILSGDDDPHVLMLKRNSRSIFVGDMWVYPGGAVDPDDATQRRRSRRWRASLTPMPRTASASNAAALPSGWRHCGRPLRRPVILLAHHDHPVGVEDPRDLPSGIIDLSPPDVAERFSQYRDEVNAGERDFIETVRSEDLLLDGNNVYFIGRWVTPMGSPRRYDTRFFLTAMPVRSDAPARPRRSR